MVREWHIKQVGGPSHGTKSAPAIVPIKGQSQGNGAYTTSASDREGRKVENFHLTKIQRSQKG